MAIFYHVSRKHLNPGDVIPPGGFGRLINQYTGDGKFGSPWLIAREMIFEMVRVAKYRELPSRLTCAYVVEDAIIAKQYQAFQIQTGSIYAVEFVDPAPPVHRGEIRLLDYPPHNQGFVPSVMEAAEIYWRGENRAGAPIDFPEILVPSALRVVDVIERGPPVFTPVA